METELPAQSNQIPTGYPSSVLQCSGVTINTSPLNISLWQVSSSVRENHRIMVLEEHLETGWGSSTMLQKMCLSLVQYAWQLSPKQVCGPADATL